MGCRGSTTYDGKVIKSNINNDSYLNNPNKDQVDEYQNNNDISQRENLEEIEDEKPEKKKPPKLYKIK